MVEYLATYLHFIEFQWFLFSLIPVCSVLQSVQRNANKWPGTPVLCSSSIWETFFDFSQRGLRPLRLPVQ